MTTANLRNRQCQLISHPKGMIQPADVAIRDVAVRDLEAGEVLLAVSYVSVDPALLIYTRPNRSGIANEAGGPFSKPGGVVYAWVVGEVIASTSPEFPIGSFARDIACSGGIQQYTIQNDRALVPVDPAIAPLPAWLGVLGMPGLTAYAGIVDVAGAKTGDTVVVSAAAGGVGSIAGQIAKALGCRVIGIAGTEDKCRHVSDELGFDLCINHRADDFPAQLDAACLDGIDVYFDNVGGRVLDACLGRLAIHGRIAGCGSISSYNAKPEPLLNYGNILARQALWKGFSYYDLAFDPVRSRQAIDAMTGWVASGAIRHQEQVFDGIENFVPAMHAIYDGHTTGKVVLKAN